MTSFYFWGNPAELHPRRDPSAPFFEVTVHRGDGTLDAAQTAAMRAAIAAPT